MLPATPTRRVFNPLGVSTHQEDLAALRHLVEAVEDLDRGDLRVVEVGSWAGRTALNFLRARPRRRDVVVYCVDTWQGSPGDVTQDLARGLGGTLYETFLENVGDALFSRIVPCVGPSALWARLWNFQADLIFIDAEHTYEAARADILAWRRHVRPGGILCGHDYGVSSFPGVTRAVDELVPNRKLAGWCLWWT